MAYKSSIFLCDRCLRCSQCTFINKNISVLKIYQVNFYGISLLLEEGQELKQFISIFCAKILFSYSGWFDFFIFILWTLLIYRYDNFVIINLYMIFLQELLAYQYLTLLQKVWKEEHVPLYIRPYKWDLTYNLKLLYALPH